MNSLFSSFYNLNKSLRITDTKKAHFIVARSTFICHMVLNICHMVLNICKKICHMVLNICKKICHMVLILMIIIRKNRRGEFAVILVGYPCFITVIKNSILNLIFAKANR